MSLILDELLDSFVASCRKKTEKTKKTEETSKFPMFHILDSVAFTSLAWITAIRI